MAIKLNETILTCAERDKILLDEKTRRPADNWSVESGFTDMMGEFGDPRIETTWEYGLTRIKDIRHPNPKSGKDLEPCEHYRWIKEEEEEEEEEERDMNKDNISIDTEHNLVYITISDSTIERTVGLSNGVNLDLNDAGCVTGIELILNSEDMSHFL